MQKKSKTLDIELLSKLPLKVDLVLLKDQFSAYKNPVKKIFDLQKKGSLVSIKRGLYFNMKSRNWDNPELEVIANSLYFPSYISAEWALQYYGLLLDRVYTITSVTTKRSTIFKTPSGEFSYSHIHKNRYPVGYILKAEKNNGGFLIARPEKALLDYISLRGKDLSFHDKQDIVDFLEEDLRLDVRGFLKLVPLDCAQELLPYYHRNSKEARVLRWIIMKKESSRGKSN